MFTNLFAQQNNRVQGCPGGVVLHLGLRSCVADLEQIFLAAIRMVWLLLAATDGHATLNKAGKHPPHRLRFERMKRRSRKMQIASHKSSAASQWQ